MLAPLDCAAQTLCQRFADGIGRNRDPMGAQTLDLALNERMGDSRVFADQIANGLQRVRCHINLFHEYRGGSAT